MNATIDKFGYPATLLHEYEDWVVLLRPAQPTLGSLVLACKEDATSLGTVSAKAYAELATVIADLERALSTAFDHQKINYLALMMVDPHVHFHVSHGTRRVASSRARPGTIRPGRSRRTSPAPLRSRRHR
jgi:diadenosine tetraphosphate (Ap4A) HIT family hydrolase